MKELEEVEELVDLEHQVELVEQVDLEERVLLILYREVLLLTLEEEVEEQDQRLQEEMVDQVEEVKVED
jgi:hypothetical protein